MQTAALQARAQLREAVGGQARARAWLGIPLDPPGAEHVGEVGERMSADAEREVGGVGGIVGAVRDRVGASIDDRGKRREPVLVEVLGAKPAENRVAEMRLHQLGRPRLPFPQVRVELVPPATLARPLQEQRGAGRRTGACVEARHVDLALGKGLIQRRQVADRHGQEGEAVGRLDDLDELAQAPAGHRCRGGADERSRGEVEMFAERGWMRRTQLGRRRPIEAGVAKDHARAEQPQDRHQAERPEEPEHGVSGADRQRRCRPAPGDPQRPQDRAGNGRVALDPPRQQENDEELGQQERQQDQADYADDDAHFLCSAAMPEATISEVVTRALAEDVGDGDATTLATVPEQARGRALITQKAPGVVFGVDAAIETFRALEPSMAVNRLAPEGLWREAGEVMQVEGSARAILTGERTALNFLQRLSGVATMAALCVQAVSGTGATILDTRKTTPGLRALEKAAVAAGGATNHRFGLFDAILIKENHAALAGGVGEAVRRGREYAPGLTLEVECRTLAEVDEALAAGAPWILLDNMSVAELGDAVRHVDGRAKLEASGGVTLQTLREIASTGVDFVSVGALTHSAPALDLSLLLEPMT
ncbi:MAG: carboxylating nicotinate-nucleotide diphosphorylase [Solirubrobacteraceae bacterium]